MSLRLTFKEMLVEYTARLKVVRQALGLLQGPPGKRSRNDQWQSVGLVKLLSARMHAQTRSDKRLGRVQPIEGCRAHVADRTTGNTLTGTF